MDNLFTNLFWIWQLVTTYFAEATKLLFSAIPGMGTFFVPFNSVNIFTGLHQSLYADHTTLSSLMAVTGAAVWSHLWHYPDDLPCFLDAWRSLDASFLPLLLPFLMPLALWFGLDRFLKQSETAFKAINHIVSFERGKLASNHEDPELKQCLELMQKNRREYEELLKLCDQFPGQREKADLDRLRKARKKISGSGDLMRFQCGPAEFSDSTGTDTDWTGRNPDEQKTLDSDSERTYLGYTDEEDDDAARLSEAVWRYEGAASNSRPPTARPRTKNCNCDY